MKVLVTGGRSYRDRDKVFETLRYFDLDYNISLIIHGAAPGADTIAGDWAYSTRTPVKEFPANWDNLKHPNAIIKTNSSGRKYDAAAGFRRNTQMMLYGPDAAIVFPGGNGTKDMLKKIRKAGIYVWIVQSFGTYVEGDFPPGAFI